jgi:hypothetical protein
MSIVNLSISWYAALICLSIAHWLQFVPLSSKMPVKVWTLAGGLVLMGFVSLRRQARGGPFVAHYVFHRIKSYPVFGMEAHCKSQPPRQHTVLLPSVPEKYWPSYGHTQPMLREKFHNRLSWEAGARIVGMNTNPSPLPSNVDHIVKCLTRHLKWAPKKGPAA